MRYNLIDETWDDHGWATDSPTLAVIMSEEKIPYSTYQEALSKHLVKENIKDAASLITLRKPESPNNNIRDFRHLEGKKVFEVKNKKNKQNQGLVAINALRHSEPKRTLLHLLGECFSIVELYTGDVSQIAPEGHPAQRLWQQTGRATESPARAVEIAPDLYAVPKKFENELRRCGTFGGMSKEPIPGSILLKMKKPGKGQKVFVERVDTARHPDLKPIIGDATLERFPVPGCAEDWKAYHPGFHFVAVHGEAILAACGIAHPDTPVSDVISSYRATLVQVDGVQ